LSPLHAVPPALEVEPLLEALDRHQVDYVLIGGLAARLHGSPLMTFDIDITPSTDRDNLARLAGALRELDAKLRVSGRDEPVDFPLDERSFDSFTAMTLVTRHGLLDVRLRPTGRAATAISRRAPRPSSCSAWSSASRALQTSSARRWRPVATRISRLCRR
jgi:hypothetical protein